jgi:NTE family protein
VLGGGATNLALMAGAVAAFNKRNKRFDVVSTSGAGALVGLIWLAPKKAQTEVYSRLRGLVNLSVSDHIYKYFPINYKVFQKGGPIADFWRSIIGMNPFLAPILDQSGKRGDELLFSDWVQLLLATVLPPYWPDPFGRGLSASHPFIDNLVDFGTIRPPSLNDGPGRFPYFYLNAYNMTVQNLRNWSNTEIDAEKFRAALALPFVYPPYPLEDGLYYEGALVDCLNFKDLVQKHKGLETIVVLDVLGNDDLIRPPRYLYDAWVLSIIIPLVETAKDDLKIFELLYRKRYKNLKNVLPIDFEHPGDAEILDWSISNSTRLFQIGFERGLNFVKKHDKLLPDGPTATPYTKSLRG